MNLHLILGRQLPYDSLQESVAIAAWRKNQRIELYRTIALATASANPEKAQQALRKLLEEQFPEVAKDREHAIERAMAIMEKEKNLAYQVAPVGSTLARNPWNRLQRIMHSRRQTPRPRSR